jgi:3-phenylpropionate/trans-cinnamate dioxygenase ferredoxin reductase subunit
MRSRLVGQGTLVPDLAMWERALAYIREHPEVRDVLLSGGDPLIMAAGDCTARRLSDGSLLRLESVQNATEMGKSAAAALMGVERPFTATPWFWSDQYDQKLQMAGLSTGADTWLRRGDMEAGRFSVYHLKAHQLVAVDSVNASKDHLQARKLIDTGITPTAEQIMDETFELASLLEKPSAGVSQATGSHDRI